jgi:hypothetical protein
VRVHACEHPHLRRAKKSGGAGGGTAARIKPSGGKAGRLGDQNSSQASFLRTSEEIAAAGNGLIGD